VNVAIWEKEVPFNPNNIVFGEKRYLAGKCPRGRREEVFADIASTRIPEQGLRRGNRGFEDGCVEAGKDDYIEDPHRPCR
jgi:hypothetical protein